MCFPMLQHHDDIVYQRLIWPSQKHLIFVLTLLVCAAVMLWCVLTLNLTSSNLPVTILCELMVTVEICSQTVHDGSICVDYT